MEKYNLDQIYSLTAGKRDVADGSVSWRSIHFFDIDLEEALNEWQNRRHEIPHDVVQFCNCCVDN